MPYRDSSRKRTNQRKWDRERRGRDPARQAEAFAEWKKRQDPNKRREREQEQRFRWAKRNGRRAAGTILTRLEHARPRFLVVDRNGVLQPERWETPAEMIERLRKKGVLMTTTRKLKITRKITAEEATEMLADYFGSRGMETAGDSEAEAELWMAVESEIVRGARSAELAELHRRAIKGDAGAEQEANAIIAEIRERLEMRERLKEDNGGGA